MSEPEFFGQIALKLKYVRWHQLDECLRLQKRTSSSKKVGEILIEKEYLTPEQVDEILTIQKKDDKEEENIPQVDDETVEKMVLLKGFATERQVREALRVQEVMKNKGKALSLAEIMLTRKYVTITQLKRLQADNDKSREDPPPKIEGYEIKKKMGKGGMGTVYQARQVSMDRIVALKVLAPELADDKTYVERFLTEAKAVGKLKHENIVSGIDAGKSNGYYYFAMEFINGETVLEHMKREKILPLSFALAVTYQTGQALEYAEKHKITHRDIKPGNIMVDHHGMVKLCDLGFAKIENNDLLTRPGTTLGSPYYMSPEQCRGKDIDTRSDIYSLGATLYHMVVGRVPFNGRTASEILRKHLTDELVIPQETRARIGEYVCHVIEKMMEKDKDKRYITPPELLKDLEPIIARFRARPILLIRTSDKCSVQDIALLLAEGAYIEGGEVELVDAKDLTTEHLIMAGAVIIGASADSKEISQEVKNVINKISQAPDMKGKMGAAFIGLDEDSSLRTSSSRLLSFIFQGLISSGMIVMGDYSGVLGGCEPLGNPEGKGAEACRLLGRDLVKALIKIAPVEPLVKNLTSR